MKQKLFLILAVVILVGSFPLASAYGQDGSDIPQVVNLPDQIAEGRDVTITVSNKPPADLAEQLTLWEEQVARFEAMYPNVHIEGLELDYDPTAFIAMIAGNQLPTLFQTYFTEPEKFISQGAVADLTSFFEESGIAEAYNPNVLAIATYDGKLYGIPTFAYSLGIGYNIGMLEAAGYDAPPATWDELAEMAVALTDKDNNVAGFAFINDGTGASGWHYTNIAYGFGAMPDDIIKPNGDGTYTATFGEGATVDALQYVHDLRWTYDVLPGASLDWTNITDALVSDRAAMVIYAGDQFSFMKSNFPDADLNKYGYAPVPAGPNGRVALTGGNLWMINGSASADEQEAAFYFLTWRELDPAEFEQTTITRYETGQFVGQPVLPLYVGDYQTKREEFEAQYTVLPVENYQLFNDAVKAGEVTLQAEPPAAAQDYYSELGVLVSEILSSEGADPATRLAEVAEEFQLFVLD
ncbi:MAG TPA: sugar ABC transporter substrate-binding protein [Aggregatilinea sp.]|uniref:ABC transporter substrate-binding protein n=1 Tax=Aggregatilinea sp. TaxID=2806333 RepID=UPI002B9B73BD|nr:sugar ABC transporter substrate-binding protein [Aggregatilinea sp.]HML23746.1 sugar ABC transporter substrate-binding protein [Aggregatilinea sp.]